MRKQVLAAFAMAALTLGSCTKPLAEVGDQQVTVFNETPIRFSPKSFDKEYQPDENGVIRLMNGRVILKKVTIPHFEKHTDVNVQIRLVSAGDAWDKSGSAFIIPAESGINIVDVAKGLEKFPAPETNLEGYPGISTKDNYKPSVELMRFMTPFGVGYYSDSMQLRKPVYVPHWEKEVVWKQDVTHLLPRLEGEVWVGAWIDTWTEQGYELSLNLEFDETEIEGHARKNIYAESLVNTVPYVGGINNGNMFYQRTVEVEFEIPEGSTNNRLLYTTTGHGGHSGGDEFVKKENKILVDSKEYLSFIPWRDDCASFRRFNPHSGVWTETTKASYYDMGKKKRVIEKEIEERIASSDYSRSNWCPGTDVVPESIDISDLKPGKHKLTIAIPEAQQSANKEQNHWLVSATLIGEKQ